MKNVLLLLSFYTFAFLGRAQDMYYFVPFQNKIGTPFEIENPLHFLSQKAIEKRQKENISITEQDLPVNPAYTNQIKAKGATILYTSKWFNGVVILCSESSLNQIKDLTFVKANEIRMIKNRVDVESERRKKEKRSLKNHQKHKKTHFKEQISKYEYGSSYTQNQMIGANQMHQQGFMGEGIVIAVFDSGFKDADKQSYFHHLFQNKKILDTYDFVRGEKSVFEDDEHGRMTLSCIAAYEINKLVGTAPKADFYLFRTEDASSEFPIEEYNWLKAAEVADSLGVDIVSSSLGYTDFDDNNSSYQTYQMDGKTAVSSRAAQILAQKGVVVVSSAGNEGGSSWNIISAPADAADILSIGSVNSREAISYFSSRGYTADGRVKPDVLAMGSSTAVGDNYNKVTFANGTSFSCPTAAGVIAGFWQANPQLSSKQVLNYIRRSGKQYDTPDAQYGYGVLSFSKAHYLAQKETTSYGIMTNKDSTQILCYPNPYPKNNKDTLPTIAWGASYQGKTIEISIFDSSAKLVFEEKLANIEKESIINIFATLPKGEYLISIKPNYSQQKSWRWIID